MAHVILQTPHTFETRAIRTASMLLDHVHVTDSTLNGLSQHARQLAAGALPVGSVEFVRQAMKVAGLAEPENISYPEGAKPFLDRFVSERSAGEVIGRQFVKPVQTKFFTGFVFDTMQPESCYNEHDREQYDVFMSMAANERVFVSDPVLWVSEWRYYVAKGIILGQARYDQNDAEFAPTPELARVQACIQALGLPHPYALDFGVLSTGESALVEVNDAWAIGLYGNALSPRTYLAYLQERWAHLLSTNHRIPNAHEKTL